MKRKDLRSFKAIGASCAVAGLVSTWDTPAAAQTYPYGATPAPPVSFSGMIDPTHDLSAVYFLFAAGPCAPAYSKKIADFVPANTATDFAITIDSIYAYGSFVEAGSRYSIIGVYDTANSGVSLAFDPTAAGSILSQSPAPGYNGPWTAGYNTTSDEAQTAAYLLSGNYNGHNLDDYNEGGLIDPNNPNYFSGAPGPYFATISTDPLNPSAFTLVDFSGASAGGSGFVVEAVPEPGTISLLAAGAALASAGVRRRKTGS